MPLYKYSAINEKGKTVRGELNAANDLELEDKLKNIGQDLVSFKEVKRSQFSLSSGKASNKDLIVLCVQLQQLEKAGVPILDALADMRDTLESPKMKNVINDVHENIRQGAMMSAAMANHPEVFDTVFVGLIEAGEKTGQLGEIYGHLASHLKWVDNMQRKVSGAIRYPIFLLLMMCGVIAMMMMFVVPQLTSFLESQGFDLPLATIALIATSRAFENYWWAIFGGPVAFMLTIYMLNKFSETFAYHYDAFKLRLPAIGSTIQKIEMARFCRFFSITFRSGIGVLECLEIASKVVKNRIMHDCVDVAKKGVADGGSLTASIEAAGRFPKLVIRMIKIGEDSGNLDTTLENVNYFYDKEVDEAVDMMIGLIQPSLTICMGALMGWVTLAVFGPLYDSFSKMNF